jgi:hypothetical protein
LLPILVLLQAMRLLLVKYTLSLLLLPNYISEDH